jgi:hypothetical protein
VVYGSMTVDGTVEEGPDGTGGTVARPMSIRMAANDGELVIMESVTPEIVGTLVPAEQPTAAEGGRAEAAADTIASDSRALERANRHR